MDAIAAAARVNKRMLYHHFGDKAGLFRAVCEERVEPLLDTTSAVPGGLERLDADAWRILGWHSDGVQRLLWRLSEGIAKQQQAGVLRSDIAAPVMAVCLVAVHALPGLLGGATQWPETTAAEKDLANLFTKSRSDTRRPRVRMRPELRPR